MTRISTRSYHAGVLVMVACLSLLMDVVGKEAFIVHCDRHWVSSWITVPLALMLLLFGVIVYSRCRTQEDAS